MKQLLTIIIILIFNSFHLRAIENISQKTWTEAFKTVHQKVKDYYPFLEHKAINIDSLYNVTLSEIKKTEEAGNDTAYFIALKKYAFALNDNHVFLKKKGFNPFKNEMEGHYGFEIIKLDNDDVVVSQIRKGKIEPDIRITPGTKIISWNGIPIDEKIKMTSLLPAENMEATPQNQLIRKCELLMFGALKDTSIVEIEDKNGNRQFIKIGTFPSKKLKKPIIYPKVNLWNRAFKSPVDVNVFDDEQIGYIRINGFMPNLADFTLQQSFKNKLWLLQKMDIKCLIIDLRGNQGGVDTWAAKMAGHFVTEPKHYQSVSSYNPKNKRFETNSAKTLIVEPQKPYFDKPVIILVDNKTASTGEGMPMILQSLPNVKVAGQYNTCGVFASGFTNFIFKMPEDIVFGFLEGRSLDENGNIQVDADENGNGGITPEIKIPVSLHSVKRQYSENEDYVLDIVISLLNSNLTEIFTEN